MCDDFSAKIVGCKKIEQSNGSNNSKIYDRDSAKNCGYRFGSEGNWEGELFGPFLRKGLRWLMPICAGMKYHNQKLSTKDL
jgi:hypothetical protein